MVLRIKSNLFTEPIKPRVGGSPPAFLSTASPMSPLSFLWAFSLLLNTASSSLSQALCTCSQQETALLPTSAWLASSHSGLSPNAPCQRDFPCCPPSTPCSYLPSLTCLMSGPGKGIGSGGAETLLVHHGVCGIQNSAWTLWILSI